MFSWINIFQFVILYSANDWKLETTFNVNLILSMKSFIWEHPSHWQSRRLHIIGLCPIFFRWYNRRNFTFQVIFIRILPLCVCHPHIVRFHFLFLFDYFGSLNEIINLYRISEQSFIFRFSQHSINHVGLHASFFFYTYKYTGIITRHSKKMVSTDAREHLSPNLIHFFFFQYSRQNRTTVDCRQLFFFGWFAFIVLSFCFTTLKPFKMPETWEYFRVSSQAAPQRNTNSINEHVIRSNIFLVAAE